MISVANSTLVADIKTRALRDFAVEISTCFDEQAVRGGLYGVLLSSESLSLLEEILDIPRGFWDKQAKAVEERMNLDHTEVTVPKFQEGIAGFDANSWKEYWLISDQVSTAKSELIRLNSSKLQDVYQKLLKLLEWPNREELARAISKIGDLQKQILIKALDEKDYSTGLTQWQPETWLGTPNQAETEAQRVAWAKAIQKLEHRGLITRHTRKRTVTHLKLTKLGIAAAKTIS